MSDKNISVLSSSDTVRISVMISLIAVCSWISVPAAVPFTMQTLAVFLTMPVLGGKKGTIAVVLYVLTGCTGLPVFSGFRGGISHILSPTGGYIIGFILIALCYRAFEPFIKKSFVNAIPVLFFGLLLCYSAGTAWFYVISGMRGNTYSFSAILSLCVLPYILPDTVKLFLAMFLYKRIRKYL